MNFLEYMGIAFLAMVAIFTVALVLVQITGGVELFDEQPTREDINRLVLKSDEEVSSRPHVRAGVYQSKGSE